jgi:hypothetical protein
MTDESTGLTGGGSVGAAGTERARQLAATAEGLPVPIKMRQGELTGDIEQLRFEETQARGPLGAPLREQEAKANRQLFQNLAAIEERTGAATAGNVEQGRVMDSTLRKAKAQYISRERAAWRAADASDETLEVVDMAPLAEYLNQNRASRTVSKLLKGFADELKVQEVGSGNLAKGDVNVGPMTLRQAEAMRKSINRLTETGNDQDYRFAKELKGIIDKQTEGKGGGLYQEARRATTRKEQLFGENAVVRDLIRLKAGTKDRAVALGDIFDRVVMNGTPEDLSNLRRTLLASDQSAGFKPTTTGDGPGAQAWRELQGATVRRLVEAAEGNYGVSTDMGQSFSGARYRNVLKTLDKDGRLKFILGPKQAQALRDVDEIAQAIKSLPPGTVSSSGSAEAFALMVAEAGATGVLAGLPLPIVSLAKIGVGKIKDNKTRARIQAALNYNPGAK